MNWPTASGTWSTGSRRWCASTGAACCAVPARDPGELIAALGAVRGAVDAALAAGDFRSATSAVWAIADEANRYVSQTRPWLLAAAERGGDQAAARKLDAALAMLLGACRDLARELEPFLPGLAARIAAQCTPSEGRLPDPKPVFARLIPRTAKTG